MIRNAIRNDREDIRDIYFNAFPTDEWKQVANLAETLLITGSKPVTVSLVAEIENTLVGHVAFSPVSIQNYQHWSGYILAPLAIKSDYQRRQFGTELVNRGIEYLTQSGVHVLFVYGDPDYYSRFGFSNELARQYRAPYQLTYPFGWQAIKLDEFTLDEPTALLTCVEALNDADLW